MGLGFKYKPCLKLTDHKNSYFSSNDIIRGSEVPMLVIFTTFMTGPHNEDVFSRCTSSLIVVCNEEAAYKIVPPNAETEFAYTIPVHSKFELKP